MKTDWDYTGMAEVYLARPAYSDEVLAKIFKISFIANEIITYYCGLRQPQFAL